MSPFIYTLIGSLFLGLCIVSTQYVEENRIGYTSGIMCYECNFCGEPFNTVLHSANATGNCSSCKIVKYYVSGNFQMRTRHCVPMNVTCNTVKNVYFGYGTDTECCSINDYCNDGARTGAAFNPVILSLGLVSIGGSLVHMLH